MRKVTLEFFQDDATGEYGLAHEKTIHSNYGSSFNAFWSGQTIFHDVFEHWFEYEHKYFMGENAMNVGGEIAAMGALTYYYYTLGVGQVRDISPQSWHPMEEKIMSTITSEMEEAVYSGYCNFGDKLNCGVPYQKPVGGDLDYIETESWAKVKKFKNCRDEDADARRFAREYRKSITPGKLQRLYRWGYRMAEREVPDTAANRDTCVGFIQFWNEFCSKNSAEEMYNWFKRVVVRIWRINGEMHWSATFEPHNAFKKLRFTDKSRAYALEYYDVVKEEEAYY